MQKNITTTNPSILKNVVFLLSIASLCLGVIELINHNLPATIALILFACYASFLYYLCSYSKCSLKQISLLLGFYALLTCSNTYFMPTHYGVWISLSPLLIYLLVGFKLGPLYSSIFVLLQALTCLIFCTTNNFNPDAMLHSTYYLHLAIAYMVTWVCIHLYEKNKASVEESLMSLATRDPLTGVKNRLSLSTSFEHYKQNKHSFPQLHLLILDIDYFKQVNDTFGHDIGDKVLIDLTLLSRKIVGDEHLYRIGGEEFCIMVFENNFDDVLSTSEKLRKAISEHIFNFGTQRLQLTASIGICSYQGEENLPALLKLADLELYKAKNSGRNQIRICEHGEQPKSQLSEQFENN